MADPTSSQAIVQAVETVATPIRDTIFEYLKRHSGYLFSYKGKIKKLQEEVEELCQKRNRIQAKVDSAENSAQVIYDEVLSWLNQVQAAEKEVDDFLANERKENKQCFKCTCPNLIWRHRLGKGAEERKVIVANLKEKGGKLELAEVAQPARFPTEMLETSSEDYMNFQSRDLTISKILEALKNSNVKMIFVHGPGGVGKTRMVKEVTKQINKGELFEQVVEATISQEPNVKDIQDQLAAQLNLKFDKDDPISREGQLYNRLKGTKKMVLVIMDDVWKKEDMDGIGIPFTDCKILITSRYKDLCEKKSDQKDFSIEVLKDTEAWELFKKTAEDISVDVSKAKEVCKECGGLPLVILVVGAALKRKKAHDWNSALNKLKNADLLKIPRMDSKIYTSLKLSYDYLKDEEKSLFLLFCLFSEDAEVSIDDLVRYSMALRLLSSVETFDQARDSVLALVEYLKSSNLLLNGKNEYYAKMHDIVRDIAICIAREKESQDSSRWPENQQFLVKHNIQQWPEKGTRESSSAISLRSSNVIIELPNDFCCPEIHTLILELGMSELPQGFFAEMKKLTVLVLINMRMLSLPPSLANLVSLRMLFLNSCQLEDMNVLKNLEGSIEILSLKGSKIEVLPLVIGQLTRLRLLDLENVWPLQVIPEGVFSNLLKLEELYVGKCSNLEDGINSSQLTTLHIHVPDVHLIEKLPLERLTRFRILVGDRFLPLDHYFSSSARILGISNVHIKDELKILLERTESLYLILLEGLKCLDNLPGELKYSSSPFSNLTSLSIKKCGFEYLLSPSCARSLERLQLMDIEDCKNLEFIVATNLDGMEANNDSVIRLPCLRVLKLKGMENLKGFRDSSRCSKSQPLFNCQVLFPHLNTLEIEGLASITKVCELELACQLRSLCIQNCPKVEEIISVPEKVKEANTSNDDVVTFPALERLSLGDLPNFKKIYSSLPEGECLFNHQVSFPVLKYLTIHGLTNIIKIWEVESMIQLPSQLCLLGTRDCANVEVIISIRAKEKEATASNNDVIKFFALGELTLKRLPNFRKFCSPLMEGSYLFNHQVSFPVLKYLTIHGLTNTIKIWEVESMIQLPSQLCSLGIRDCANVEVIISIRAKEKEATASNNDVIKFPALGLLTLERLPNFKNFYSPLMEAQYLFSHQVSFPVLKYSTIRGLTNIIKIWEVENMIQLPSQLRSLEISDCANVEVIISIRGEEKEATANNNDVIKFLALRELTLKGLPNFRKFCSPLMEGPYLFNHQVSFPVLECLIIGGLTNILKICEVESMIQLPSQLRFLEIRDCANVEVIFSIRGEEKEATASNNDVIKFLALGELTLEGLPNFRKFYSPLMEGLYLFNHQVEFPCLCRLTISAVTNIEEIWSDTLPVNSFGQLIRVVLRDCDKITSLASSKLVARLQSLQYLNIAQCDSLQVVFRTEGWNKAGTNAGEFMFPPQLRELNIEDLPNLESFFSEPPLLQLPSTVKLIEENCPKWRHLPNC